MFHYYPFYPQFTPSFYQIQNTTPIATFNLAFQNPLQPFNQISHNQQPSLNHSSHGTFADATNIPLQGQAIQDKNLTTHSIDQLSDNSLIQSSNEKNSSLEAKLKKIKLIEKAKLKDGKRKARGQKKDKAYVAKQYPKQEPSISCRYIQKNFELNIINQVFSFLWSQEKSHKFVKRFFKDQIKVTLYYEYIKIVRKFCKRYINKEYLKNLCNYQNNHIAYKMVSKNPQKLEYLSMAEFSQCIRHLIFIYLHQLCPQAVLTSKKMRKEIWGEHLIKCRLLRDFMFYNLSAQEYERELIHNRAEEHKITESTSEELMS